ETLFTAVVVWSLVLISGYVRGGRAIELVGGTALLAASAYVRPAGYFLPLCLVVLLVGEAARSRRWGRVGPLVLAGAAAVVVVAPWQLRNRALGFRGMSTISGVNMYFYNAAALRAAHTGMSFAAAQAAMGYLNDSVYFELHPEQRTWRPGERFQFMADAGRREVRADLARYARIHVAGMVRVLVDPGGLEMLKL